MENEASVLEVGADEHPLLKRLPAMLAQHGHCAGVEGDRPAAAGRLRFADGDLAPNLDDCLNDAQPACVEVDVGPPELVVVTEATTHRSLYVGATRGRFENRLLVVADGPSEIRDVLERVLSNERADVPAIAQRRNLVRQVPQVRSAQDAFDAARRTLCDARQRAEPYLRPVRAAEADLRAADQAVRDRRRELSDAPVWRRRSVKESLAQAMDAALDARSALATAEFAATPYLVAIDAANSDFRRVELETSAARMQERILQVALQPEGPALDRGLGF